MSDFFALKKSRGLQPEVIAVLSVMSISSQQCEEWEEAYHAHYTDIKHGWGGGCGEMVTEADIVRAAIAKANEHMAGR